ncbi:MAG: YebC/PmpR family DNA-binding transcriptional regulator [Verrucomicrobia bacterium]|nr:YebC/PmpR family DNA-binding transcriptional regulator [Verrucomicrobiota bacterium]
MSGHSKWATIRHKKGALDAKRGKIFSKLAKEITVAAKQSGGDADMNPRLRAVLLKARAVNMPADNIDRAIKRGTGEMPGVVYEEITYEGFAPGGVAIIIEAMTDNKNRTSAELRNLITKNGGNMGGGSVKHLFHRKGHFLVDKSKIGEDELMEIALDAGADDMTTTEGGYEITCDPPHFEAIQKALEAKNIKPETAEITFMPVTPVPVTDEAAARTVLKLVNELEDHDDVQHVYAAFDIPDDILAKVGE